MKRTWTLPDGRRADLNYFVNWRPWLWAGPVARALGHLGDLRGRRVLEVGGKDARMASLLALAGAEVTLVDLAIQPEASTEIAKWGVADRVRLIQTAGDWSELAGRKFDAVFTKSVLVMIEPLAEMLERIDAHLADGGRVAFVENYRGSDWLFWVRRHVVHRRDRGYVSPQRLHGIVPGQLPLFRERFADVTIRRRRFLIYEIFGHKRT